MLELAQQRHAAAKPVPWIKRVNKLATQKLISRAKTLALASAPPAAGPDAVAPSLTSRLMTVPQIQQPQELFNSAMKPVRKLKPRTDLRYDQEVASNLVCASPAHGYGLQQFLRSARPRTSIDFDVGSTDHGYIDQRDYGPIENLHQWISQL